ncbi:MAG: hypothetical protein HYY16_17155 [Planctomycetes bacterium]|nr:hypothetical protein [Planctomycetota bacterium]
MSEGLYQRLLGLPPEMPAPDYYQLLGLQRGWVDPNRIIDTLRKRLESLAAADPSERDLVEFLRRELQRARATLDDPGRRAEYDEQLKRRRLEDLRAYFERMVANGSLGAAAEKAMLHRMSELGIEEAEARAVVDEELEKRQMARGRGEADEQALREAQARLEAIVTEIADQQLISGAHATAPAKRETKTVARAALPEPAPVRKEGTRRVAASPPPEPPAPRKVTTRRLRPEPSAPVPVAGNEGEHKTQIAQLKGQVAVLERTKALLNQQLGRTEPAQRGARRRRRSLLAMLAVILGFAAGDLVAAYLPAVVIGVDGATAGLRGRLAEWESRHWLLWIGVGGALLAAGAVVWLAGRPGKRAFLVPTGLLCLGAFCAGLIPMGEERALEERRATVEESERNFAANQTDWQRKLDEAEERARRHAEKIAEVERQIEELKQGIATREAEVARQSAAKDQEIAKLKGEYEQIYRMVEEQTGLKRQIAQLKDERAKQEEVIQSLRKEMDDLRKKAGEKK